MTSQFVGMLPISGSVVASHWNTLFYFLFWLSAFFFVLVIGAMCYFIYAHNSKKKPKADQIEDSTALEIAWTVIPTILVLGIFVWGYSVYHEMTQAPSGAYEVRAIGKQWMWQFQYDHGATSIADLYVPANRPVKVIITSEDVLHNFYLPDFRVKIDAVPGMYTSVWFEAKEPGVHRLFCAAYCGTSHSEMLGRVIALPEEQFKAWQRGKKVDLASVGIVDLKGGSATAQGGGATMTLAEQGRKVFETKACITCHSTDGSTKVGPSLKGVFSAKVELMDGSTVVADENYLRESIENPQAKIVKGFGPLMPTFKGLLSEQEVSSLIAYLKTLK